MAPWGPGAITKITWGKVYIPHCGIYHGEQGMNPIRTKSTGKNTGKLSWKKELRKYAQIVSEVVVNANSDQW
jgi:hypothetical protein